MYTDISKLKGIISVILLSRFLCYLLIPQRRVPQNSPGGPIVWERFFLSYQHLDFLPPYDPFQNTLLIWWLVGWLGGWVYLPFGTLDHVRTTFFQVFSIVRCLAQREIDFKISLSSFEAIFQVLSPKYSQKSTLQLKLVPVI